MQVSFGRLFGYLNLAMVSFGAAAFTFEFRLEAIFQSFLAAVIAPLLLASFFASLQPWLGAPKSMELDLEVIRNTGRSADPSTAVLCVLAGLAFMALGSIGAAIYVENNLTMDSGGASKQEWLEGSGLVFSSAVGGFARGYCLLQFLALLCGYPALNRSKYGYSLCFGSFLALFAWPFCPDPRGWIASGISISAILLPCIVVYFVGFLNGPIACRSRWCGASLFLVGSVVGAAIHVTNSFPIVPFENRTGLLLAVLAWGSFLGSLGVIVGIEHQAAPDPPRTNALHNVENT